ncbi:MAG: arginine-tRNA-protein transferase [Candidatus Azotimanducaceae bacterium]
MTSLSELRFFKTPAHECSYLPGREATTLFVDPLADVDTHLYSELSAAGFRRSGEHIYKPYCEGCNACIPVRVPVHEFKLARRQKRNLKANHDVVIKTQRPYFNEAYYALYERYIAERHSDGDMYPATRDQFKSFLVDGRREAIFFEMIIDRQLAGVAVVDQLDDGLSAIYTFFDPDLSKRGLGSFAVLWIIEEAKRRGLPNVYLGYWIKQCQKMSYKIDYRPLEMFVNNHWMPAVG